MPNVSSGALHPPAGRPTIEESFDEDTMSRGFDLSTKGGKAIDSSGNRMPNGNA